MVKEIDLDSLIGDFIDTEKKLEELSQGGRDPRILKLAPHKNPYILRFLPNTEARQLIVNAWVYEWKNSQGKYVWGGFSPKTFDINAQPCYYDTVRNQLFEDEQKDFAKCLYPIPYRYVNVLVVDDPNNSENNGEIMALRYKSKPHREGVEESGSPIHIAVAEVISDKGHKPLFTNTSEGLVMKLRVKKASVGFKYDIEFKPSGEDIDIVKLSKEIIDLTELFDQPFTPEKQEENVNTRLLMKKTRRRITDESDSDDEAFDADPEDSDPLPGLTPHIEEPVKKPSPEKTKPESKKKEAASQVDQDIDALMRDMGGDV